jgi:hypothetical protein
MQEIAGLWPWPRETHGEPDELSALDALFRRMLPLRRHSSESGFNAFATPGGYIFVTRGLIAHAGRGRIGRCAGARNRSRPYDLPAVLQMLSSQMHGTTIFHCCSKRIRRRGAHRHA